MKPNPQGELNPQPASARFRFRLVARGEIAGQMSHIAVQSLRRCHPAAAIVLVDANDEPQIDFDEIGVGGDFVVIHIPPGDDEVARAVGRGSRHHLYYWRHAPQLLEALPFADRLDAFLDCDVVHLRPMDLGSLLSPLEAGRILATVDESTLEFYDALGVLASGPAIELLPSAGAGGPLIQGGMLFANPRDDGSLYARFWELAVRAAKMGVLESLPWDDMCLLTSLLGQGGPLWGRLQVLGHEWNYITDARKHPGVFGVSAHFGGRRAQSLLLSDRPRLLTKGQAACWGAIGPEVSGSAPRCVVWPPTAEGSGDESGALGAVPWPWALSWPVESDVRSCRITVGLQKGDRPDATDAEFRLFLYVDGRFERSLQSTAGTATTEVSTLGAETLTAIGVPVVESGCASVDVRMSTSSQDG